MKKLSPEMQAMMKETAKDVVKESFSEDTLKFEAKKRNMKSF